MITRILDKYFNTKILISIMSTEEGEIDINKMIIEIIIEVEGVAMINIETIIRKIIIMIMIIEEVDTKKTITIEMVDTKTKTLIILE